MSAFDLAVCMDASTLDRVVATLYGRPGLRDSLFRGSHSVSVVGVEVTVAYDVLQPPTVSLQAPSQAQWEKAVRADGSAVKPEANALVAHFPKVSITKGPGTPDAATATVEFDAIAVASLAGGRLAINPVGVCIDLSGATPTDQAIYRGLVIPRVLQMVGTLLAAEAVPNISFQGAQFGPASLVLGAGRLGVVANLSGKPGPAVPAAESLPAGPLCVLMSQEAMQRVADGALAALRGKRLSQSGSATFGIGKAEYTATLSIAGASGRVVNPLTVDANVQFAASASASVDVLGYVWDQISGTVTDVGNAIGHAFSNY